MNWLRSQLFLLIQHWQWSRWQKARIAEAKKQKNVDYQKCLFTNCDKCRCGAILDCE